VIKSKEVEMGGVCGMYGGEEQYEQGFKGKPEGKRPFGRHIDGWIILK